MAKEFKPRASKKDRKTLEISNTLHRQLVKISDEKLLKGAQLADIHLSKISVRDQVRTKFNDESLRELAENIRINGLIQPLVLHRENDKFILLCGERRFRAMNLIKMEQAPCFIIEGKTKEELMAIQFSENSAREELHYVDKAEGIYNYQVATGASERKIQAALGISKSEVHRSLIIAKLPLHIKEAAKKFNIEKYVLVEYEAINNNSPLQKNLEEKIVQGQIVKRSELNKAKILKVANASQTLNSKNKSKNNPMDKKEQKISKVVKISKTPKKLKISIPKNKAKMSLQQQELQ